ncbi:type II secretion system secretin GspD [Gilvimarinus sp. 1_MG-2023]|uniref:type II secretion system secretin GspD n=1 Tax=Gilvimarinus sp. 1_MG-2023 TaxID=3062638 RepID=UPI0026E11959|nr:type II secretion system secretin GspD [Gilvimarinus sp. 1_MG-2023]MDO6746787.1 type II secretion system secretin GspD [Gilvimarinus sp. 1_MG-2023]
MNTIFNLAQKVRMSVHGSVTASMICLLLSSCTQLNSTVDGQVQSESSNSSLSSVLKQNANNSDASFGGTSETATDVDDDFENIVYAGSDQTISTPKAEPTTKMVGDGVSLNFENTPLIDVVHGILGDILAQEYQVQGNIPGVVTLRTQAPIPRDELLVILESMLQANGAALVKRTDGRYLVTVNKGFRSANPSFNNSANVQPGYNNVIVPLQFIGAAQMAEILRPVAPDDAFVRVDTVRNLLILGGTSTQLNGWLDIIDTFDVDFLAGMSVGVFPIEYTSVAEVELALATLMATSVGEKASPLSGLIRTVPLESLGAVMVVTPRKELLGKVQTWIERLDRTPSQGAEPQLYVYEVQNSEAGHLAQLIGNVFGGGGVGSSNRGNSGVAPGLTPSNLSSDGASGTSNQQSRQKNSSASSYSLGEEIKIVADDFNNSLLIYATANEYKKIKAALEQLDVMPSQILIEASIIEVTLNDDLQYGLEWYFDNNLSGGWSGDGYVGLSPNGTVSVPSFGYAFTNALGSVQTLLSAESTKELVKVLSNPSIMVLDNHAAKIHVGTQQPIRGSQTISDGGVISNSVNYRDTGVKLDVVPSVNAGGLVTLDLVQSVTDIGPVDAATDQASFFERNIESRVAVRSGHTVVLGGLISDNQTKGRTGLPFLKDLPLIGGLFGSTTANERRTELLVIITPHVMKTDQDIRAVNKEMRSRMKGLKAFEQSIDNSKLIDPNF